MVNIFFIIISIVSSGLISYFALDVDTLLEIWIFLVLALGMYVVVILSFMLVIAIMALFVDTKKKYTTANPFYYFMVRSACSFICSFMRIRLKVIGKEKLPRDDKYLVVSNHTSNLDPIMIIAGIGHETFGAIAKPGVLTIPVIGKVIHRTFILAIDRDNPRNAVSTIMQAGDLVKNETVSMILYPEGTRNKGSEPLLPFKNGGFKIAQKADCPIVVIKTTNARSIKTRFPLKSTKVTLEVVDVIKPDEYKGLSTNDIGDRVRDSLLQESVVDE